MNEHLVKNIYNHVCVQKSYSPKIFFFFQPEKYNIQCCSGGIQCAEFNKHQWTLANV